MEINFFVKGIILGFSIAAPVGPIGVLCVRKTLQFGRLSGFFSGLGAAVADTVYGVIAAFGLTLISSFLLAGQFWFQLIGGVFLIYLGLKTFYSKPAETNNRISHKTLFGDFISTFFLTVTNPMTILSFVAVFASIGGTVAAAPGTTGIMLLGILSGSALWWLMLTLGVSVVRRKIDQRVMQTINRVAGLFLLGFAVWQVVAIVR